MLPRSITCGLTLLVLLPAALTNAAPDVAKTAAHVDELLAADHFGDADAPTMSAPSQPAPLVDDATYLRRVSLDLIGQLPTPEQLTRYAADHSPKKRAELVNTLLADSRFGQNWGRYRRNVIYYRRSDDRAMLGATTTADYLAQAFNNNTHWDQIATAFITATGNVHENGACGIILAQMADPSNVTAEMSRIFMGVQIQCAQCHNHPFDRWRREQFHELAAFFPRIAVRPGPKMEDRTFNVVSLRRAVPKRSPADTEGAKLEHYMPDLEDPTATGTMMTPTFYATGQKLSTGLSDVERRAKLAEWMTARGNHWFDKAFVNRLWGELMGHGFQEPLDDLGPDRKPTAPKTFEFLSRQFAASNYDIKWLFRVITSTQAYQRVSRPRHDESADRFAASCTQWLRGDQVFSALLAALGVDEETLDARRGGGPKVKRPFNTPRGQMNLVFGYDPSDLRDEVASSIPQALVLMNSPQVNRGINARNPYGTLGRLLDQETSDTNVATELYRRTLARDPKPAELKVCMDHVHAARNRAAGFEDIQWALINSTEFLHRK